MIAPPVLRDIVQEKRRQIALAKKDRPLDALRAEIFDRPGRGFRNAIETAAGAALIAELKKASPSKGLLRADFSVDDLTDAYVKSGASALSVLTEPVFFQGRPEYLQQARERCELPVLRKDFIVDSYQIYESRALGADCILLIAALLDGEQLAAFAELAHRLEMEVLVEVHSVAEIQRAALCDYDVIGVNNRNLKTMTVSLDTSASLANVVPSNAVKISESGIFTREDVLKVTEWGYKGVLVGEALVVEPDPGKKARELLGAG